MARYQCDLTRTGDPTNGVAVYAPASGMRRAKIYDFIFAYSGTSGTAADAGFVAKAQRSTAAPTGGTSKTPNPLDAADAAAVTLAMDGAVTNGTLTSNVFLATIAGNIRSTVRWVAKTDSELVIPATASNGIHLLTPTNAATVALNWGVYVEEQ